MRVMYGEYVLALDYDGPAGVQLKHAVQPNITI